jgi:two-component system, LytTR family, response regulator
MSPRIRCLIVDPDPEARRHLLAQLDAHKEIHVLAAVETVAAALPLCHTLAPDLVFLDEGLDGMEKFAALPSVVAAPLIVLLASNKTDAFAAWENHAIDFLLKPYSSQRLAKTVAKLRMQVAGRAVLAVVPPPLAAMPVETLKVAGSRGPLLIKLAHISAIKAEGDYSRITGDHGVSYLIRRTLVAWVKLLAHATFFRVDRFTLINLVHVVSYHRTSRDHAQLRLKGMKEPVHLGRRAILRLDQEFEARPPQFCGG